MMFQHVGRRRTVRGPFSAAQFYTVVAALFFVVTVAAEGPSLTGSRKVIREDKQDEGIRLTGVTSERIFAAPGREKWPGMALGALGQSQASPEPELGARTVVVAILGALAASLSSAAGLGGGPLFVPLLTLVGQFATKTAAVISNCMILGGTSVGVALNLRRDHPHQLNKSLIDFDIALLLQPNMLLGITMGVIVNGMLPNWLISAILTLVLLAVTVHTTSSGLRRWRSETSLATEKKSATKHSFLRRATTATEGDLTESLLGFYRSMSGRYPVKTILGLLFVWLAVFTLQLLRDGHGREGILAVKECGIVYWALTAAQIPFALGVSAWVIYRQRDSASRNEHVSSDDQDQGYVFASQESLYLSGLALLVGIVGGMLGVGGAVVIGPLLLSVGVHPQVTTATTQFMVFFSSSMSVAQYWLMGRVPEKYALIAALICAVFSAVGILGLQRSVNKYGRPSLIVFCIAFVLGLCVILMATLGGFDVWREYKSGAYMGFSYPC